MSEWRSIATYDGTLWRATAPSFADLQASPAGFGPTKEAARAALIADFEKSPRQRVKPDRFPPVEEFEVG